MSYFILYFEKGYKNRLHGNMRNVPNDYFIDQEITEGRIRVQYEGVDVSAGILASRMDASLFYVFKRPTKLVDLAQRVRSKLYKFIKTRIDFGIESHLFVFDLHGAWPSVIEIHEAPVDVDFSNLDCFFERGVKFGLFVIKK